MVGSDQTAAAISAAISEFGGEVTPRLQFGGGDPEAQLSGPFERLLTRLGQALRLQVDPVAQASLPELNSRPDFAVRVNGRIVGYAELKAPGKGVNPAYFRGHDRHQWMRIQALPNLMYVDGNAWSLHHYGEESAGSPVNCEGSIHTAGRTFRVDTKALTRLLSEFFSWETKPPRTARQRVRVLAGLCGLLRDEVVAALHEETRAPAGFPRPFSDLASDWRKLLFPRANAEQFADSYAQTITFALLLAHEEGVDLLDPDLRTIGARLELRHDLLGRALQVLTDHSTRRYVETSLSALAQVIDVLPRSLTRSGGTDWQYFYQHFLDAYDTRLRQQAGAYYTPVEVVEAQVRLVETLLRERFGFDWGFASDEVVTIDPAMGSRSYLIEVIAKTVETIKQQYSWPIAIDALHALADRIIGFEIMASAYTVAEVFVRGAFRRYDENLTPRLRLYLTRLRLRPTRRVVVGSGRANCVRGIASP